jgi:hypothetical protein
MIDNIIKELETITIKLQNAIKADIDDVKKAEHESLLERNEVKISLMESLSSLKAKLNEELSAEFQKGNDVSIYRESIDNLENELKSLYYLNGRLASIVLPVREMYKDIIDEITQANGGHLIEVTA